MHSMYVKKRGRGQEFTFEDSSVLGWYSVSTAKWLALLPRIVLSSSSGSFWG